MLDKLKFLEQFGRAFVPKKVRPGLGNQFLKAGIKKVPYHFFGFLFYVSAIITGLIYIFVIYSFISTESKILFAFLTFLFWVILQLGIAIMFMLIIYFYLDYRIFQRTRKIEEVLPEFLRYLTENLKGGMPFDKALWNAIRPQYGILAIEIRLAAKRVMTGEDVEQALWTFAKKYDSPMLKRTMQLIIEGMKGGGRIAYIIDRIEENLRETAELKKEMSVINTTYVFFLAFIVLVAAPALFGLSYNLQNVLQQLSGKFSAAGGAGGMSMPIDVSKMKLDPSIFKKFSLYALAIISTFSAMIISIIRKGNVKEGLRFIPFFVGGSLLSYLFFSAILNAMFGGMIT